MSVLGEVRVLRWTLAGRIDVRKGKVSAWRVLYHLLMRSEKYKTRSSLKFISSSTRSDIMHDIDGHTFQVHSYMFHIIASILYLCIWILSLWGKWRCLNIQKWFYRKALTTQQNIANKTNNIWWSYNTTKQLLHRVRTTLMLTFSGFRWIEQQAWQLNCILGKHFFCSRQLMVAKMNGRAGAKKNVR